MAASSTAQLSRSAEKPVGLRFSYSSHVVHRSITFDSVQWRGDGGLGTGEGTGGTERGGEINASAEYTGAVSTARKAASRGIEGSGAERHELDPGESASYAAIPAATAGWDSRME